MDSVQATPLNCRILNNSPALHSLKRQQLVQLCKRNGIKASGKNSELIEKLKAHASDMSDNGTSPARDEDKENKRIPLFRPSEVWSVIEEDSQDVENMRLGLKNIQEEVEQEMFTQSTLKGFGTSSFEEYPSGSTNSKGTITSSFKNFANTFKKVGNKMSTGPGQVSFTSTSTEEPPVPLLPELATPVKTQPSPLPSPATGDKLDDNDVSIRELGQDTIRLVSSHPTVPSPPALRPFTPTFEACYSPESQASPFRHRVADEDPLPPGGFPGMAQTPSKPPVVQTNTPAPPPFVFGSPAHQTTNTQFHSAAASILAEMNARLGLTGTSNEVGMDILEKKNIQTSASAPIFSKTDKAKTEITHKFDKVHEQRFQQMEGIGEWYARKCGNASPDKAPPTIQQGLTNKKRKSDALEGPSKRIVRPSATNARRVSRAQGTRIVSQTITNDQSEERQAKRPKISFVDNHEAAQGHENAPDSKLVRMEVDEDPKIQEEREKERAAIKKRLEVSRARRRSSMGRVSVGANKPALIPNQPKKGITTKFGFLSSAKNLVKNVWNRGVGTAPPQKAEVKPKTALPVLPPSSQAQTQTQKKASSISSSMKNPARKPSHSGISTVTKDAGYPSVQKPLSRNSTVATNATGRSRTSTVSSTATGSRRAAIPSFSRLTNMGRTNSLTRAGEKVANTSINGTGQNQNAVANSIGFRNPPAGGTRASETGASSTNGVGRKRTSTLLAPTASSLARMQHTVKPPSLSAKPANNVSSAATITKAVAPVLDSAPTPSRIPTFTFTTPRQIGNKEPESNNRATEKTPGTIFASGPPSFTPVKPATMNGGESNTAKQRPLPGRRPRISRSRVIARVGAQRSASSSSNLVNSASGRRSLNTPKTRGSLGVRASGIGSKSHQRESLASNRRKRLRQSEVLRRRSKISTIGTAATHNATGDSSEED